MARAAAQPKYAPRRPALSRVPFSSAGRRASDGLSPLRAEGPREKVALCAKNGCKAQAKAAQRTTWARQGYAALQQAVSGSCSAHRRRSVTGPLRERKQQCTRNTEKAVVKKRRGDQAPPANQERAKKLGMNTGEEHARENSARGSYAETETSKENKAALSLKGSSPPKSMRTRRRPACPHSTLLQMMRCMGGATD